MPNELMFSRNRYILVASVCIQFAAWPVGESWAGWQKDLVCQGSSGGGCPGSPAPTVPKRSERVSNDPADRADNRNNWHPIDPVEEQRRQMRKEAQDKLIQKNWVSVSSLDAVIVPGNTVSIAPGSGSFNTVPSNPRSFTAPIARVAMKGTPIPNEALRRAVAILAVAKAQLQEGSHNGNEEIAYLVSQAASALEGAPLQVIVSRAGGVDATRAAEAVRPLVTELGQHQAVLERAITARRQTLKAYSELKKEQDADGIDPPRNIEKHRALAATYEKTSGQVSVATKQLDDDNLHVQIVICAATTCQDH